jgi:hypothetical protein
VSIYVEEAWLALNGAEVKYGSGIYNAAMSAAYSTDPGQTPR